jgi:hypothetical protein
MKWLALSLFPPVKNLRSRKVCVRRTDIKSNCIVENKDVRCYESFGVYATTRKEDD